MKTCAIVLFIVTVCVTVAFPQVEGAHSPDLSPDFCFAGDYAPDQVLAAVDWNVIMMIAGTMGIVALFIESGMPARLADLLIRRTPNVKWSLVFLALFAGIISAFIDNVATVLMVAPVALSIARKLKISPVPGIIAISVASNLQGAATLVGDATSILLGGHAGLDFLDFFILDGKPGLFWVVQAGAIMATLVLLWIFRRYNQPINSLATTEVRDYFPSFLLAGMVVLLILASFVPDKPAVTNGLICMLLFAAGLLRKGLVGGDWRGAAGIIREIDFFIIALLTGLFIVVGGITEAGVVADISKMFSRVSDNVFIIYSMILWVSVPVSAFIDNIHPMWRPCCRWSAVWPQLWGWSQNCFISDCWPDHPGRQPHAHRGFRQHRCPGHPQEGRPSGQGRRVHEDRRPLYPDSGDHRLYSHLADLELAVWPGGLDPDSGAAGLFL